MSKDVSEVAFIPDNISNISSGRQAFNEDTSQKIEDYSVSKVTKNLNIQIDHYSGLDAAENKNSNNKNHEDKELINLNQPNEQYHGRISFGKNSASHQNQINLQKVRQALVFQSQQKYAFPSYTLPLQQSPGLENNPFSENHTGRDVISQKLYQIEKNQEKFTHQNDEKWKNVQQMYNKIKQEEKNSRKTYNEALETHPETENETLNIVEIDKYDEFQTEKGWLEHYVTANNKLLYRQTNSLLAYNQALLNQIEKVQLRTKVIELQIETNKLKIALRKSPSTKHINFSVDFKMNRSPILKIPKKFDIDLRKQSDQLQKKLIQARSQSQQNETFLKLLEFYQQQFKTKVSFTYIYQQYLLEKGNNTLLKNYKFPKNYLSRKSLSKNKEEDQNQIKSKSKNKNPLKSKKSIQNNHASLNQQGSTPSFSNNSEFIGDQSVTSLANNLNIKKGQLFNKISKNRIQFSNIDNESQYYQSPKKQRIQLIHHRKLQQPSNKNINDTQSQKSEPALFNSANRSKKHFYYECQKYLQELQKDYLIGCEDQKRKILVNDQRGFRQRELLKMKAQNMKNEILDTQVDVTTKQNELKRQNLILLKELQLLQSQFAFKYEGKDQYSSPTLPTNRQLKTPSKSRGIPQNQYDLLYKQAEKKLKNYKSATLLENISKQNMTQSPLKKTVQNSFDRLMSPNRKIFLKRTDSQEIQISPIKGKNPNISQTKRLKSQSKNKLIRSESKQNKFINRFKQSTPIKNDLKNKNKPSQQFTSQKVIKQHSNNKQQQISNTKIQNKVVQSEYYIS